MRMGVEELEWACAIGAMSSSMRVPGAAPGGTTKWMVWPLCSIRQRLPGKKLGGKSTLSLGSGVARSAALRTIICGCT